jgi:hypothetical protein
MEHRERRLEPLVLQVQVERGQLVGRAQGLVGDGPKGQGRDVEAALGSRRLGAFAGAVRAAFRVLGIGRRGPEDRLDDARHGRPGLVADRVEGDRRVPPRQEGDALHLQGGGDRGPAGLGVGRVEEGHGQPQQALARIPTRPGPLAEQAAGERKEHPGSVTRLRVGGERAAMADAGEGGDAGLDDRARGPALGVGHEADAAGVPFVALVGERHDPSIDAERPGGCPASLPIG